MDTLRAHTYDIIGIANKLGAVKRREAIDSREVEKWIREYRATIVTQTLKRDRKMYLKVKQSLVQDLGCILLDCVDQSECSGLPTGSYVSKAIIPAPLEIEGALDYVGVINKRKKFIILDSPNELGGKLAAPFSEKFVFAWRVGTNALYVATQDSELYMDMCYINVRMIVADPTTACYKKSLSSAVCCYDKTNDIYPVTDDMMSEIKMLILSREMNISMQFLSDQTNNNRDDRQSQMQKTVRIV